MRSDQSLRAGVILATFGVVFGDIGTSPIYSIKTLFHPDGPYPVPMGPAHVYGAISLVFWSVMTIVTLTYVLLVMRVDNDGEGGVMALVALLRRYSGDNAGVTAFLSGLGIFGAALFFGDSMITPAVSVLSAVEGLEVVSPDLAGFVVPVTVVIIAALFALQRKGTAAVGRFFGPVMVLWFAAIAACGIRGISQHPQILRALSPVYALQFAVQYPAIAFFSLGAIVLAVTGAEALYADMGHFGRRAITVAWLGGVLPALTLNYFGQGAELLGDNSMVSAPFFMLAPSWAQFPMVLLATAATVIASQAVITGSFSVAFQAVQLGYLPRLRVRHTSEASAGQIYVPWINGALLAAVLALVVAFRSSAALAYAYGMAVSGTIVITTVLFLHIARSRWRTPTWLLIAGGGPLLIVELLFLAANLTKLIHGAWLPLLIAVLTFTVLTTWRRGSVIATGQRAKREGSLRDFIADLADRRPPPACVPGTAVFLTRTADTAPMAMRTNVEHNRVLHERTIVLSIDTPPIPRVRAAERVRVDDLGYADSRISYVRARFGYMEPPDVPSILGLIDPSIDPQQVSYFLSRVEVIAGSGRSMSRWRKRLFIATAQLAADAAAYFNLPVNQTAIIGARIEM